MIALLTTVAPTAARARPTEMENSVYTTIDIIPTSAAGASRQIRFSALLGIMQDAAYAHAAQLGLSYNYLSERKKAFFLSRMQIKVCSRLPEWGERVVLQTWPRGLERLFAYRDFELSHEGREPFLKATTSWLMIDTEYRHPVRPQEYFVNITPRDVRLLEIEAPRRLGWEENVQPFDIRHARASDLDPNGHVNNTRYIDWITDAIAERHGLDAQIGELSINFLAEVRMSEEVRIGIAEEPTGEIAVQGETGKHSFAARARLTQGL
jgi:medium-chain acyl-[acyl-carrier-protein] hydrolase